MHSFCEKIYPLLFLDVHVLVYIIVFLASVGIKLKRFFRIAILQVKM